MTTSGRLRASETAAETGPDSSAQLGEFGCLLGGVWESTGHRMTVRSPYDGSSVAIVHRAGPAEIERAIAAAVAAFGATKRLPSWRRSEVLERISGGIAERREDLARTIALEAGKPIRTARLEVDRAAFTFKIAAEEARRIGGEIVPLDWLPGTDGREAHVRRVPLGPIVGIAPFNFPINLVAHKVAPALAAGNPMIVRPASQTPVSSLKLGQIVLASGWPADAFSVVPCAAAVAAPLVEDDRIRLLTFTGSPAVGWDLKRRAGRKRVTLELGGNAAVLVHRDADLAYAAERIVWGGFSFAGQTCVSVQRVYVEQTVLEPFMAELLPRVRALKVGDPLAEDTDVGPLIDVTAAERVEEWLAEALSQGARVLAGGHRAGSLWEPTVVTALGPKVRLTCQEVFAPLVGVYPYTRVEDAIAAADDSDYGLQAGLFTHDERVIAAAFEGIDVGGLMVNDVSTFRIDHMPYGGVKHSGFGREGLKYAIEEMTEQKLVAFNRRR